MKNIKKDTGITLVALVVTIVVMLILAGISVNLVIGDNGIIKVTKQIKSNTIQAESEAQEKINNLKGQEKYTADGTRIIADEQGPTINRLEITQLTNNSFKVSINVTEKESGIKEIRYSKNDGESYEKDMTNEKSKSLIYSDINPETYQIKVQVEDNVGNFSEASKNFEVIKLFEEKSDEMLNKKENTTLVIDEKEITIPAGYKLAQDSADTIDEGMVITDAVTNGNEWVWVPVEDASVMYETTETPVALTGNTGVSTQKYSSSGIIDGIARGKPGSITYREVDLVVGSEKQYDEMEQYYKDVLGYESAKEMAEDMVSEYDTMIRSIEKYQGFYIGRYELSEAGEKKNQNTLTSANWYQLYMNCKSLSASDKAITRMIWGCQWDITCKFIANYGEKKSITDSRDWGNYSESTGSAAVKKEDGTNAYGTRQNTGFSEYWRANNIYDLAGNCWEWTQEALSTKYRASRGTYYGAVSESKVSYRGGHDMTVPDSVGRHSSYLINKNRTIMELVKISVLKITVNHRNTVIFIFQFLK